MEDLDTYEPGSEELRSKIHRAAVSEATDVGVLDVDEDRVRTRYVDGQILGADGFGRDQRLFVRRQQDLGRLVARGVVEGLGVARAMLLDENDVETTTPDPTRLSVAPGHGVTRDGHTIVVRDNVEIDLTQYPIFQRLDAELGLDRRPRPPARTQSGVFALVLRQVEFTANPVAPYPTEITGPRRLEDGDVIEATAFTFVPVASESSLDGIDAGPAAMARRVFVDGLDPLPADDGLPIAIVALERGTIAWIDVHVARREAKADPGHGFEAGHRADLEAHARHFSARMESILARRAADSLDLRFAASEYFEVLPPAGELPTEAVTVEGDRLAQWFFPVGVDADLALVPEDELPALLEEAIPLGPYDLSQSAEAAEATPMLIVVPVTRERFGELAPQFAGGLRQRIGPRLGSYARRRPVDALIRRVQRPSLASGGPVLPALQPWADALSEVTTLHFFRQRRRARTSFALPRYGPIPVEQRPSGTLSAPIRARIEAAGELSRFDRLFAQAGPDALERIAAVLTLPWFGSDPLFVNAVIAELSSRTRRRLLEPGTNTVGGSSITLGGVPAGAPAPLRVRPVTLEEANAVASRYEGPPELGEGMDALYATLAVPERDELRAFEQRLVIAQSLRLPELDERIRETHPDEHPDLASKLLALALDNEVNAIRDLVGYIRPEPPPLEVPRYDTGPASTGFGQAEAIGQAALFSVLWNNADDGARAVLDGMLAHPHAEQPLVATTMMMSMLRTAWGIVPQTTDDVRLLIEHLYRWPFAPDEPFSVPGLAQFEEVFISSTDASNDFIPGWLFYMSIVGDQLAGALPAHVDHSQASNFLEDEGFPRGSVEAADAYRILGCAYGNEELARIIGTFATDFAPQFPAFVDALSLAIERADLTAITQIVQDAASQALP